SENSGGRGARLVKGFQDIERLVGYFCERQNAELLVGGVAVRSGWFLDLPEVELSIHMRGECLLTGFM
ncbi:hypothetical protein, partial [Sulfitobacter geojensis]|uniref:hypothetical protein n=1 Tax=Sulfitobacter geojensis TaxID=1342299 RepID=UPI001EECFF29